MVEAYLSILELGHYELKIAFEGLADENVWKRPAEGLLSVGELAGHIAYWEAVRLAGEGGDSDEGAPGAQPDLAKGRVSSPEPVSWENGLGMPQPDLAKCRVRSPLIDPRFAY